MEHSDKLKIVCSLWHQGAIVFDGFRTHVKKGYPPFRLSIHRYNNASQFSCRPVDDIADGHRRIHSSLLLNPFPSSFAPVCGATLTSAIMENSSPNSSTSSRSPRKTACFIQAIVLATLFLFLSFIIFENIHTSQGLADEPLKAFERYNETDVCLSPPAIFLIVAAVDDEDVIAEMEPLLLSMIYLTSRSLHFVFVTNSEGVGRIKELFSKLPNSRRSIKVEIACIDSNEIMKWADELDLVTTSHHSGLWGMAKIAIPWLLPSLKKAVVVDTDMIFMKDPHELWADAWNVASSIPYRMPLGLRQIEKRTASQICSCVVALNAEEARKQRVYPDRMRELLRGSSFRIKDGKYIPRFGDQSVYHLLMEDKLVEELGDKWNLDRCHAFRGALNNGSSLDVGLLHHNCMTLKGEKYEVADIPFKFFGGLKWHWMQGKCSVNVSTENSTQLVEKR